MRLRIALALSALVAAMILAAGVPLALAISATEARTVQLDRLADAARIASLVAPASDPVGAQALEEELHRYDDVYGNAVAVADRRGRLAFASRSEQAFASAPVRAAVRDGLAGRYPGPAAALLPWRDPELVVWLPVVQDGEILGAVVTISSAEAGSARVRDAWTLLGLGAALALGVGIFMAWRLASWIISPLTTLEQAARSLRPGRFSTRVPSTGGPPEMRRLADSFNHMAESVQTSFEAQDAFVADAGHQLRNPLGALLVRLDGLALDLEADGDARVHAPSAAAAARDGRYLAATLETMLELARAQHNDSAAVPMDVARVLDERLLAWSVLANRRRIAIERSGLLVAPALHDPAAVAGALDVVLDNALKYSPEAATVHVEVVAAATDPAAMDPAAVDGGVVVRVTNPAPSDEQRGGAGIGLAIASTLLHLHGGRLRLDTAGGAQTVVALEIPGQGDLRGQGVLSGHGVVPDQGDLPGQGFDAR